MILKNHFGSSISIRRSRVQRSHIRWREHLYQLYKMQRKGDEFGLISVVLVPFVLADLSTIAGYRMSSCFSPGRLCGTYWVTIHASPALVRITPAVNRDGDPILSMKRNAPKIMKKVQKMMNVIIFEAGIISPFPLEQNSGSKVIRPEIQ